MFYPIFVPGNNACSAYETGRASARANFYRQFGRYLVKNIFLSYAFNFVCYVFIYLYQSIKGYIVANNHLYCGKRQLS